MAVTDALGQTTTLERKPDGEVVRITHPDGTAESFTYNVFGQVLTHTDGKGQITRLMRNARGLPSNRQDAKGGRVRYEYDNAIRLTSLINENNAAYRFAYDASDRLIEEVRVDNLTRRFSYNLGGHLTRLEEIGYGENGERPQRHTDFERDPVGRLVAKANADSHQAYAYDSVDRLLSIERKPSAHGARLGITEETLGYTYDLLGRLTSEITPNGTLTYEYDPLGNLTTLTLPDGRKINNLYYGSGHLHQINLDGEVITDIERDDLHREVYRTQGKLTSCFGYDAMGRRAWQFASTLPADKLSQVHNKGIDTSQLVDHGYNPIYRRYQYDPAGELVRTLDKLRGEVTYSYEANGQLRSKNTGSILTSEEFRYDPAGNQLDFGTSQFDKVGDNRIRRWRDQTFRYDPWGNLIEKCFGQNKVQRFSYDCENRLVKAETHVAGTLTARGQYKYDCIGRRVFKDALFEGLQEQKWFLWQGLRLLQENSPTCNILYVYEGGSYRPLARVDQREGRGCSIKFFHTDQVGTPFELTDSTGAILWQKNFRAWGSQPESQPDEYGQNLRMQGQYYDRETGFHYNTFRYYDAEVGRFASQDPIGLIGGNNLYRYADNPASSVDPLGWCSTKLGNNMGARPGDGMANHHLIPEELMKKPQYARMFKRLRSSGFNDDGASNGIFLPGSKGLTQHVDLPGHWSNHAQYTKVIEAKISALNNMFSAGKLSDTQLVLGIGEIQGFARDNLISNRFVVDTLTGRLL